MVGILKFIGVAFRNENEQMYAAVIPYLHRAKTPRWEQPGGSPFRVSPQHSLSFDSRQQKIGTSQTTALKLEAYKRHTSTVYATTGRHCKPYCPIIFFDTEECRGPALRFKAKSGTGWQWTKALLNKKRADGFYPVHPSGILLNNLLLASSSSNSGQTRKTGSKQQHSRRLGSVECPLAHQIVVAAAHGEMGEELCSNWYG